MTEATVKEFFDLMVSSGVVDGGIDWRSAFTTEFTNRNVGADLRP